MPTQTTERTRRRRSGRATPYSRSTQKKDKKSQSPDFLPEHRPTTDQVEVLKGLLSKTWHLYHVSPLWKLETSTAQLRAYSQLLMTCLTANERSGEVAAFEQQIPGRRYAVRVSILPKFGLDGTDAFNITINQRNARKGTPILECLLCRLNEVAPAGQGFTPLPLLLLRGPVRLTQLVMQWLHSTFDCYATSIRLDPEELSMIVGQYATAEKEGRGMGGVELVYTAPPTITDAGLSTVSVELPFESAYTVWNNISETSMDKRRAFVQALCDHIHKCCSLKLKSMVLSRVSTPVLHAENTGRIKAIQLWVTECGKAHVAQCNRLTVVFHHAKGSSLTFGVTDKTGQHKWLQ